VSLLISHHGLLCGGRAPRREAVYQTGGLMEWCACPRVWADEGEGKERQQGN